MAFTYNPALASEADQVRLLLGDTNAADPLLSDEEIAFIEARIKPMV